MNVKKIQTLSEQWTMLKKFHDGCCHNNTNLSVAGPMIPDATLSQAVSFLVMSELRRACLQELSTLEEAIKEASIQ